LKKGFKYTPDYIIERLSRFLLVISGVMIVLMVFTSTYGVARRYFFHSPEPYSYEISTMFLLWSFILAIAAVERYDRNIRVDFISNQIPDLARHFVLRIVAPAAGLFVCIMFAWQGVVAAMYSLKIGAVTMTAWKVPLFPIKIIIPIGYAVLCLVLIAKLYSGIDMLVRRGKMKIEPYKSDIR
jgi:TRAP-type C4-dicarboxylate transport system permease small subunit